MARLVGRAGGAVRIIFYDASMHWGGEVRACFAAGQALARRGYDVAYAAPGGSALAHAAAGDGGKIFTFEAEGGIRHRARELRRATETHVADVLVVQDTPGLLAGALATRRESRLFLVRRLPAGVPRPTDRLTRLAARLRPVAFLGTDPVVAASEEEGEARTVLGVHVGEPSVRIASEGRPPRLACLTGDEPGEVEPVLRAAAMLAERHPALRLVVWGARHHRDALRVHAAALGLATRADWVEAAPGHGAGEVVAGADLAWVVADGDAGAFACLDAMARGVPVHARRSAVTTRYLESGREGELFGRMEPALLAAAAERLLATPARGEAVARAARERVAKEFTEREMAAGYERFLRSLRERATRDVTPAR